jgi:hypothetical protein
MHRPCLGRDLAHELLTRSADLASCLDVGPAACEFQQAVERDAFAEEAMSIRQAGELLQRGLDVFMSMNSPKATRLAWIRNLGADAGSGTG